MGNKLVHLYELSDDLFALHDPDSVAKLTLEIIQKQLKPTASAFYVTKENKEELILIAKRGNYKKLDQSTIQKCLKSGSHIYLPNLEKQAVNPANLSSIKSELVIPLHIEHKSFGVIDILSKRRDAFGGIDDEVITVLSRLISTAIKNAKDFTELSRRHKELSVLYSISDSLQKTKNLDQLLKQVLKEVLHLASADGGAIRLLDHNGEYLELVAHQGLSETYVTETITYSISSEIAGWVARTNQPTISDDMWVDTRVSPEVGGLLKQEGHRSLAQVPLVVQEKILGTLGVTSLESNFFDDDFLRLLAAIGHQIGIAISNAKMIEDIQQKATKLAALNAVSAVINQPLPIEDIMDLALHEVIDVMAADAGGIRIIDENTNELLISASHGLAQEYINKVDRIRIGEGVVGHVASTGEIAIREDFSEDSRFYSQVAAEEGFRTFIVVPLKTTEKIIGTLGMVTRYVREFTEEEIDLLEAIGHQIGIAFENAQLRLETIEAERLASIGRVATSIAHDLRSPLGGILRSAEFLGRSEISPETRKKLSSAIVSMSNRLISTSQEILDFVRGEKIDLVKSPCDISDFLDETLRILEVDFSEQGIEVVKDFFYSGSIVIDKNRMAQVIYNIAVNAMDAMPYGGKFSVTSRKINNYVELSFSDTGPGIPAVLGDKIFEPYFTYGKREGVGLGLAIARSIVENHQGKITFENLKKGTKFIVSIPL